jgi:hypothetical protein
MLLHSGVRSAFEASGIVREIQKEREQIVTHWIMAVMFCIYFTLPRFHDPQSLRCHQRTKFLCPYDFLFLCTERYPTFTKSPPFDKIVLSCDEHWAERHGAPRNWYCTSSSRTLVREIYYLSKKVLYRFLSVHWTKKLVLASEEQKSSWHIEESIWILTALEALKRLK